MLNIFGFSPSKALNSSEFVEVSPSIVYCLLPGREENSGQQRCDFPRNHSELFDAFTRKFSHGEHGITHEALDGILEDINKTIGNFSTEKKVGKLLPLIVNLHSQTRSVRISKETMKGMYSSRNS